MLIDKSNILCSEQIINIMINHIKKKYVVKNLKFYSIKRVKALNTKKINYFSILLTNILDNLNGAFPNYSNFNFIETNIIDILINKKYYLKAKSFLNLLKVKIARLSRDFIQLIKASDSLYRCKIILKTYYGILFKKIKQQKNLFKYLKKIHSILSNFPKIGQKKNGLLIFNICTKKNFFGYFKKNNNTKKLLLHLSTIMKIEHCHSDTKFIKNIIIFNKFIDIFKKKDIVTEILIFILVVYLKYKILFHYEIDNNREYCLHFFRNVLDITRITLSKNIGISLYFTHKIKHSYLKKKLFIFYIFLLDFIKKFISKYDVTIKFIFMNLLDRKVQLSNIF